MDLNFLLNQVKRAIYDDPSTPQREGHDPTGLMGRLDDLFGNFGGQSAPRRREVLPASQDPYGDPADLDGSYAYADQRGMPPGVRPASEDPLGDPADQFPGIKPASEDPLGD
ncbi:MAG TPA: hypothetical protein VGE01_03270, partial [Fimbriimonas sp.]